MKLNLERVKIYMISSGQSTSARFNCKQILWDDIKDEVLHLNPKLAEICDEVVLNSGINKQQLYLYRIKYPYGAKIVDNGNFCLPQTDKELQPAYDKVKENLNYCPIPLCLMLHNCSEVFVETSCRVVPLNFFTPGELFGVFEIVELLANDIQKPLWTVTSGARSVFMLPKITDKTGYSRINKKFGETCVTNISSDFIGQWSMFKEICNKLITIENWHTEILVFSKDWFDVNKSLLYKLHHYIYKLNRHQSKLLRHDIVNFGLLWALFSETIAKRGLKPKSYILDTIRHLFSVAKGRCLAFAPVVDETAMPTSFIQKIYIEIYNLKTYQPTLMQPAKFTHDEPVYYSLAFPTTLESSFLDIRSVIEDEREIKSLISIFLKLLNKNDNFDENDLILKNLKYEFFHTDNDPCKEITNSKDIILNDSRFNHVMVEQLTNLSFCHTSLFFRGCIRISKL